MTRAMGAGEVEDLLKARRMPGAMRSWYDAAADQAAKHGADLAEVMAYSRRVPCPFVRRAAWHELREAGYSLPVIATGWGTDHGTVLQGIRVFERETGLRGPGLAKTGPVERRRSRTA